MKLEPWTAPAEITRHLRQIADWIEAGWTVVAVESKFSRDLIDTTQLGDLDKTYDPGDGHLRLNIELLQSVRKE